MKIRLRRLAAALSLGALFTAYTLTPASARDDATYYVSPTGSDSASGTSPDIAFATILGDFAALVMLAVAGVWGFTLAGTKRT